MAIVIRYDIIAPKSGTLIEKKIVSLKNAAMVARSAPNVNMAETDGMTAASTVGIFVAAHLTAFDQNGSTMVLQINKPLLATKI
jgi:hypothetical protein